MRWQYPGEANEVAAGQLTRELGLHPQAARLLVRRGIAEPQAADKFLRSQLSDLPDPFSMKGMTVAAERLAQAVTASERVVLYGDYDVDGVTSTSLMLGVLRELGLQAEFYIPNRLEEGYGLNLDAVERLSKGGPGLLISLDCGVTAVAEVQHAVKCGLEVLVVDHHTTPEVLPEALSILNPHQPGCGYPTKHLCAAGVAFCLLMATRKVLRTRGFFQTRPEPNLKGWLDLVALATIADVVPLVGANRILVKHGLEGLSEATRPGIRALKEVATLGARDRVTAGQVGFKLGPRINAAGRLGAAAQAVRLLTTSDPSEAQTIAKNLDAQNQQRQAIERKMSQEAYRLAEQQVAFGATGLVLASEGWHAGVVGIVAARMVERFHRPTLVIALQDGVGKGSGRSIEGFHLYEALAATGELLVRYGGHKHAIGLTVDQARLPQFMEAFQAFATERLVQDDLQQRLRLDGELNLGEVTLDLARQIESLGPFGNGHPEPVFFASGIAGDVRQIPLKGDKEGEPHLKLTLRGSDVDRPIPAIGWGMGGMAGICRAPVLAAFQLGVTDFNGPLRPELKLKHLKPFTPGIRG